MNFKKLAEFFQENTRSYSMNRLISFLCILIICVDAVWTILVMGKPWDFNGNKLLLAGMAFGAKVGQKWIENQNG